MSSKLPASLVKDFAKMANKKTIVTPQYIKGTAKVSGTKKYVQLDGSSQLTPIAETVDVQDGDRVLVSIENHQATILGNFTFPPSARKEQEAIDKAEEAGTNSNLALENATEAKNQAATAMENASTASSQASEAIEKANDAIQDAATASGLAQTAQTAADAADQKADQAISKAQESFEASSNAQNEVAALQGVVEGVQDDITEAVNELNTQAGEIEGIKTNYSTKLEVNGVKAELETEISQSISELSTSISQTYAAKTDVVEIQGQLQTQITQNAEGISSQATKIEELEGDTQAAQQAVNEAKEAATQAQNTANQAAQDAATAQANAEAANEYAEKAQTAADQANILAIEAKADARVADEALQAARTALDEAKANYESVINDPESTAEQIAQAEQAVNQAAKNVNQALADAATAAYAAEQAQNKADQAADEAATAKANAETAQTTAENAQTIANNAKEEAMQAQQDVAALTQRVTTAETNISQNAEQIALTASKTEEIGDLLQNNYYTKEETQSQIDIAADEIELSVTQTVETKVQEEVSKIEVGARNLLLNSSFNADFSNWTVSEHEETVIIPPENLYIKSEFDGSDPDIPKTIRSFNDVVESSGHKFSSTIADFWKYNEEMSSYTGSSNILYNFGFDENTESYHISLTSDNLLTAFMVSLGASGDDAFLYFRDELYPKMLADSSIDDIYVVSIDYKKTVGEIVWPPELTEEEIAALKEQFKSHFSTLDAIDTFDNNIVTILEGDSLLEETGEEFVTKKMRLKFKVSISDFANANAFAGVVANFCGLLLYELTYSTYDLYFKNIQFYKEGSGSSTTEQIADASIVTDSSGATSAYIPSRDSAHVYQSVEQRLSIEDTRKIYAFSGDFKLENYVASDDTVLQLYLEGIKTDSTGTNTEPITVTTLSGSNALTQYSNQGWVEGNWIVQLSDIPDKSKSDNYLNAGIKVLNFTGDFYFKNLKLERGNKITDWSPAPEDSESYVHDAILDNNATVQEQYMAAINAASDQINLMVQNLQTTINDQNESITNINSNQIEITDEFVQFVSTTTQQLEDLATGNVTATQIQEWARFDGATLELGASDSPFKAKLSNTELGFWQGENKVAWISNNELNILTAIIAKSIGCGNYTFVDEGDLGFSLI